MRFLRMLSHSMAAAALATSYVIALVPCISGTHEAAADGLLLAYAPSVARGRQAPRASVVDVVPTVLYFLGLPLGRDMDGHARTNLFRRSFIDERPITFISTYDR